MRMIAFYSYALEIFIYVEQKEKKISLFNNLFPFLISMIKNRCYVSIFISNTLYILN